MRNMAHLQILLLFIACFADFLQANNVQEMEMGHGDSPQEECLEFSWNNCIKNPLIEVKLLSISPNPIHLDDEPTVTISVTIDVKKDLPTNGNLSAIAKVEMIKGQDLCPLFPTYCTRTISCLEMKEYKCPAFFKDMGFSCTCPIKAKEYKLTKLQMKLPKIPVPAGINGNYTVTVNFKFNDQIVGCLGADLRLNLCKKPRHINN